MALPRGILTEEIVRGIKHALYEGLLTQQQIADQFHISQPTVSRILRGTEWAQVKWPDGSRGEISPIRLVDIHLLRSTKRQSDQLVVASNDPALTQRAVDALEEKEAKAEAEAMKRIKKPRRGA